MTGALQGLYYQALSAPSDIREHLDTLYQLARGCNHVTEMGTRRGVSTRAFLYAQPEVLVCYDQVRLPEVQMLEAAAGAAGRPRFLFVQADVRQVEIEPTDLLFIDTWHVYAQMQQELAFHGNKARKYLVFHDTMRFGEQGETPGHRGIWPAIEEFLWDNHHWSVSPRLTRNDDLTILSRHGRY
jgi:hypothetical protein